MPVYNDLSDVAKPVLNQLAVMLIRETPSRLAEYARDGAHSVDGFRFSYPVRSGEPRGADLDAGRSR